MKRLVFYLTLFYCCAVTAQTRSDIFNKEVPLTWLGLDFTQVNFIGTASQWQDIGEITNADLRDKYFVSWNEIFIDEKSKYDVAEAVRRSMVKYDLSVTETANSKSDRDYFINDVLAFRHLEETDIDSLVKHYDFKGNEGLGMMFFVEGMNKQLEKSSMWVVFVNMTNKEVLSAKRVEGKAGGFGFRNYWARTFYHGLQDVEEHLRKWK